MVLSQHTRPSTSQPKSHSPPFPTVSSHAGTLVSSGPQTLQGPCWPCCSHSCLPTLTQHCVLGFTCVIPQPCHKPSGSTTVLVFQVRKLRSVLLQVVPSAWNALLLTVPNNMRWANAKVGLKVFSSQPLARFPSCPATQHSPTVPGLSTYGSPCRQEWPGTCMLPHSWHGAVQKRHLGWTH